MKFDEIEEKDDSDVTIVVVLVEAFNWKASTPAASLQSTQLKYPRRDSNDGVSYHQLREGQQKKEEDPIPSNSLYLLQLSMISIIDIHSDIGSIESGR